jgi:hypothetical protein
LGSFKLYMAKIDFFLKKGHFLTVKKLIFQNSPPRVQKSQNVVAGPHP